MSIDDKARYAAAGFIVLLVLSLWWPGPIVSINRLWLHRPLSIDELSFLGREAPSWDVVYWCLAGLFAIAVVQTGEAVRRSQWSGRGLIHVPEVDDVRTAIAISSGIVAVGCTWFFLDRRLVALAENVQSDAVDSWIRIANRLGGGMNPVMIIAFFVVAGLAYQRKTWFEYGVAMALAGIGAGLFAQITKYVVGRTRPELWLGAFHYFRGSANSFPSGHTVSAFALAGVLMFGARNVPLRIISFLLACFVAVARVLAFRHWPSDVLASALISLFAAWIASASTSTANELSQPSATQKPSGVLRA